MNFTNDEKQINKVIKLNQDKSINLYNAMSQDENFNIMEQNIKETEELLLSLGLEKELEKACSSSKSVSKNMKIKHIQKNTTWEQLVEKAEKQYVYDIGIDDIFTKEEILAVQNELEEINQKFKEITSISNEVDLAFLSIAIALQTTKSLVFPYIAQKFKYGESFDPNTRLKHDDKTIKKNQNDANNKFKAKHLNENNKGEWLNLLFDGVPYDITAGSKELGIGLSGNNHRLKTLGHDPILGWVFGTANILTQTMTLYDFSTYRVIKNPKKMISPEMVSLPQLMLESYEKTREHRLNLPASLFCQAQHFKSDAFTKRGLPVPILTTIDESFASKLYNEHYDALCFARDTKIVGNSLVVSRFIDLIIVVLHGFFRLPDESPELFEVRTRKILLISNSIASSSSILATFISKQLTTLDIGGVLSTISHIFSDMNFISKIKHEFIMNEIDQKLQLEIDKTNDIYNRLV